MTKMSHLIRKAFTVILIGALFISASGRALSADPAVPQTGVEEFVTRLYNICLQRQPDETGFNNWCASLNSRSITGTECAFGFIFSPEFQGMNVTDEQYVELMYNCFFGRSSDQEGKQNWLSLMNEGYTRRQLFSGFADSVEFENLCASYGIMRGTYNEEDGSFSVTSDRASIEAFVTRLYSVCLGRTPDDQGLSEWVARLSDGSVTGGQAAYGFFFSQEYLGMGKSADEYVEDLYNVILDRPSDEEGKASWVGRVYSTSPMIVFNGFIMSGEFERLCASYGITAGGKVWAPEAVAMNDAFTDYCFSLVNMDTVGTDLNHSDWYARGDVLIPYVLGGESMNGFDCSGLQVYIYRNFFRREIPHYAQTQEFLGRVISADQIRPGDLLADHNFEGHGGAIIYAGRAEDGRDIAIAGGYGNYIHLKYVDLSSYVIRRL